jgi:hypothetical protein
MSTGYIAYEMSRSFKCEGDMYENLTGRRSRVVDNAEVLRALKSGLKKYEELKANAWNWDHGEPPVYEEDCDLCDLFDTCGVGGCPLEGDDVLYCCPEWHKVHKVVKRTVCLEGENMPLRFWVEVNADFDLALEGMIARLRKEIENYESNTNDEVHD